MKAMSSKHIIGIGQLEPGKVVIIHGSTLQCDHAVPIMQDCPECAPTCDLDLKGVLEAESYPQTILATKTEVLNQ